MRHRRWSAGSALFETLEARRLLAVYIVDNPGDIDDGNYGAGEFTLREAVSRANRGSGLDRVRFHDSLAGATIESSGLTITNPLWILGPGSDQLTIDLIAPDAQIRVEDGGGVLLSRLRVDNSRRLPSCGGVRATSSSLTLRDVWVSNSTLGAVWVSGDSLIEDSRLTDNATAGDGGGVYCSGRLTIRRTSITDCTAGGRGGAVYQVGSDETRALEITNSLLARNSAGSDGGAVWASGVVTVTNSTLSANRADGSGGAIAIGGGTSTIRFSTLAHNTANADGLGSASGGGVAVSGGSGSMLFSTDSLYADNTVNGEPDTIALLGGSRLDPASGYNLIDAAAGTGGMADGMVGNIIGVDAGIEPLTDLGGGTLVHPITAASPANGAAGGSIRTDQRIVARTAARPDIGAYERESLSVRDETTLAADSNGGGDYSIVTRSVDGAWIAFSGRDESWSASFLGGEEDPAPIGDAVTWFDIDGRASVAGPTGEGLVLFVRDDAGGWSVRNLATELGVVADTPVRALTTVRTRSGLMILAGYNASDEIVAFRQLSGGEAGAWAFVNISDDLTAQGMTTPNLQRLVGFTTPWNTWNLAGIDAAGAIQAVWLNPAGFDRWRVDDLSALTGAGPLAEGTLTVTQTAWHAINLAGLEADGSLVVTWWVPGASWVTSNLSSLLGVGRLERGDLGGFVMPWGAIHYIGYEIDSGYRPVSVWWTRSNGWTSQSLPSPFPDPDGPLTALASHDGTISVLGTANDGTITRLWWADDWWSFSNLSELAG